MTAQPTPQPPDQPEPYRYVDADQYCLSARLLPDLNTGGTTGTLSITIEGSEEPQSAHVPVAELPKILAGIAGAGGLAMARQLLGTMGEGGDESCGKFMPDTPRAPGLCASCGDAKGWHSRLAAAPPASSDRAETTHQGPHPDHSGLTTHIGTRDTCTGPDCGPRNPDDEIREAVLDLEGLYIAAYGDTWRIAREQETHPEGDGSFNIIGIEPVDGDADIVVFQADDIAEEDAAYIAAMGPNVGRLVANLLHEIAEDWGPELDNRKAIQQAAHSLATAINNRPQ
ncbi:hypothetical protein ACFXAY_01295 [Streptomyces microflavus]|uniref:hypothetical protein n=1 Tax=Streptomyces microflavus TaxID=1919 RepID=UPI0036CBBBB4